MDGYNHLQRNLEED